MENPKGWGVLYEIPSVVGVWIFSGTTHFQKYFKEWLAIPALDTFSLVWNAEEQRVSVAVKVGSWFENSNQPCQKNISCNYSSFLFLEQRKELTSFNEVGKKWYCRYCHPFDPHWQSTVSRHMATSLNGTHHSIFLCCFPDNILLSILANMILTAR